MIEIDANRNVLHGLERIADWIRCPETEYRTGATTQVRHMSFPRSAIGIQSSSCKKDSRTELSRRPRLPTLSLSGRSGSGISPVVVPQIMMEFLLRLDQQARQAEKRGATGLTRPAGFSPNGS